MVPRVAAVLVVVGLAASGCLGAFAKSHRGLEDWTPIACDPTQQEFRNVVRQRTPDPQGDMNALARRFGDALGDPVLAQSPTTNADGRSEWATTNGFIRSRHPIDEPTLLEYEAKRPWPGLDPATGQAAVEAFASAFGWPGERIVNYSSKGGGVMDGKIQQALGGRAVGTVATLITYVERNQVEGAFVRVNLRPFWVLPEVARVANDTRALGVAQTFLRCQLDAQERTHERGYQHRYTGLLFDWLPIHNKSIAYAVTSRYHNPMGGACPSEKSEATVYVDAWTGSVLTWDWNRCGKAATLNATT